MELPEIRLEDQDASVATWQGETLYLQYPSATVNHPELRALLAAHQSSGHVRVTGIRGDITGQVVLESLGGGQGARFRVVPSVSYR